MSLSIHLQVLALAAEALPKDSCGFDCDPRPWWEVAPGFLLQGAAALPISLFFVWLLYRLNFHRWILVSACLATIGSMLVIMTLTMIGLNPYSMSSWLAVRLNLRIGMEVLIPSLTVGFISAVVLGTWLKFRSATLGQINK